MDEHKERRVLFVSEGTKDVMYALNTILWISEENTQVAVLGTGLFIGEKRYV